MKSALQKNIQELLAKRKMSVSSLERQAGLKASAVQNILHGRSKKPSFQTLFAIANQLNCQVDELVAEKTEASPLSTSWNRDLYVDAVTTTQRFFNKHKISSDRETFTKYVEEVYLYTISSHLRSVDQKYAEFIIKRQNLK